MYLIKQENFVLIYETIKILAWIEMPAGEPAGQWMLPLVVCCKGFGYRHPGK
jgi:hypothetical protein